VKEIILAIIGSRKRNSQKDKQLLYHQVFLLNPSKIVSGGCGEGGDKFAEELSQEFDIPIDIYRPIFPWKNKTFLKLCQWCKYLIKEECSLTQRKCHGKQYFDPKYYEIVKCYYQRNDIIVNKSTHCCALESLKKNGGTAYTVKQWIKLHTKENLILL